jgi:spore coat polysaccharide biosynthesis protein SpsF (cytidylyltransferase family)
VQARSTSTRLPGKVLLPLNGHTVIGEVLSRCKRINNVDQVVCAVPFGDPVRHEAEKYCEVIEGPEHDVLRRYFMAAVRTGAEIIVRITGDCPLICPELCAEIVYDLIGEDAEYASNIEPRTFPQGYDCEVFTRSLLELAHVSAGESEREHVTTWMRSADIKRTNVRSPWPMEGRLTLDTEDDYRVICRAFGHEPYQRL